MNPDPLFKKLGFSNSDRVVILHANDTGMCQASVQALDDLWDFGTLSSGAVIERFHQEFRFAGYWLPGYPGNFTNPVLKVV